MLLAAKDIFCIHLHPKVRNIPRNTQLRGRLFDKWPRKGLSGACCGPSGEVSGAPTGRGPACSAARDGDGQGVLRWSPEAEPACSAARDRGGTGSSEVQTGTGRPPGRKKSVPKGRCARRQDAKKVFRGEGAPPPEHIRAQKKRTSVRSLLFLLHYSATLRASAPGCSSDTPCRTTTAPHSGSPSLLRETSGSMFSCNSLSAFDFDLPVGRGHSRSPLGVPTSAAVRGVSVKAPIIGVSAARRPGSPRESRSRSGRPRESLRPPPGSQFSAAGVTVLSRPGSRPSAARNLPSLLLAPSAAGVTAPPRQYGRPPATGESPASSLRRASPARDSTAYRPAP